MKDSQFIAAPTHANNNNGGVMSGGGGVRREEGGGGGGAGGPGFPPPHWPPHPLHHQLGSHHSQHLPRMLGGYFGGRGVAPTAAHTGGFGVGWARGSPGQGGGGAAGLKPPERWGATGPTQQQAQQQSQAEGGMDLSQTRSNGSQPNGLAKEGVSVIASNPLRDVSDKMHEVGDASEEEDEDCMVIEEGEEAPRESHANTVVGGNNAAPASAPPRHRLHGDPSIAQEAPPVDAPPLHPSLHRHHSGNTSGGGHQLPASVAQPARSEPARAGDSGGHRLPVSVQGLTRPTSPSLHAHQAMQFAKQILAQKQLQDSQLLAQHKLTEAAYQQILTAQTLVSPNPESAHQLLAQGKLQQGPGSGGGLMHQRGDPATGSLYQVSSHHKTSLPQPDQPSPAHLYKPAGAAPVPPLAAKVGGACKAEEVRAAVGSPSQSSAQVPGTARTETRPSSSASLPPNLGLNLPSSLQVIAHPAGTAVPALAPTGLEVSSRNRQERRVDRSESPSLASRSEPAKPLPTQASAPLGARLTEPDTSSRQPSVDQAPVPELPSRTHQPSKMPAEVDRGKDEVSTAEPKEEESLRLIAEDDKDRVESMLENMFQQEAAPTPDRSSDLGDKMVVTRPSPALTEVNVVEILQDKGDEPSPLTIIKQEIKTEVEDEEGRGGEGTTAVGSGSAFMEVESELEKMFAGIVEAGGDEGDKVELPESAGSWTTKGSSSAKSNKRGPRLKRRQDGSGGTPARRKNGKSTMSMSASEKLKKRLHPRTEKIKEGSNDSSSISTGQMYKWRGPYIRVRRGQDGRPASVTLVNSSSADEERPDHRTLDKSAKRKAPRIVEGRTKGPGLYSSTLSSKYNSMVMDVTWTCIFCNRRSHCENGLGGEPAGDLFGPYVVEVRGEGCGGGGTVSDADVASEQRKRGGGKQLSLRAGGKANHSFTPPHKKPRKLSSSEGGAGTYTEGGGNTSPGAVSMDVWVHEACAVWAPGVILVGPHLIGLDEAVSLSLHSKCSVCGESGACISCLQHGCHRVCHYGCARTTQWSLDEQTFHARCLDHKKPITLSLALQQHSTF